MANSTNPSKIKVLILGAGEVGFRAAERLSAHEDKVDVTLVELQDERFAYVERSLNCKLIHGSVLDPDVLKAADLVGSDIVYAVTDSDEVNILTCQLAHEMVLRSLAPEREASNGAVLQDKFEDELEDGVSCSPLGESEHLKMIRSRSATGRLALFARVRSNALYQHLKHLFDRINIILPEAMCVQRLKDQILYPQLFEALELEPEPHALKLYGVKVHEAAPIVGETLYLFSQKIKLTIAACARLTLNDAVPESVMVDSLTRPSRTALFHDSHDSKRRRELIVPRAEDEIKAGDILYFIAPPRMLPELYQNFCSPEQPRTSSIVIAGKSNIARDIFDQLVNLDPLTVNLTRYEISMLSESYAFAEKIELIDREGYSTVVSGSVTNIQDLKAVGVGPGVTLLICSHDEENLICALLARELKCDHILIVNNREQYTPLIQQLGFDGILSPRQIATNEITHQTLKYSSSSTHQSTDNGDDVEVRSFTIDEDSTLNGVMLSQLQDHGFPRDHALIAAMRDPVAGIHVMPRGDSVIEANHTVYVVGRAEYFTKIKTLFGKRKSRFRFW